MMMMAVAICISSREARGIQILTSEDARVVVEIGRWPLDVMPSAEPRPCQRSQRTYRFDCS